ncbi:MAG: penicillin-binding protein [Acetatifactor sp.]|nr:penicillin-binding protein [Acetatifactor sp.]
MFEDLLNDFLNFITSRLTILILVFVALGGVLIYRCFDLQIVHGEEYLRDFVLQTEKTRNISSSRGNIFDRNGNLLAYNQLAYSVKIEDVYESSSKKNAELNDTIYKLIKMVEKNGDSINVDFKIFVNEDGDFEYNVEGTALLRFLADIYGYTTVDKLTDLQKKASPLDIMEYLSRNSGKGVYYAIGENDEKGEFVPGMGYSNEDWLKIVSIRYSMSLTSFRKYIGTTVASNVSDETVAVIMENSTDLPGVTIEEDTVRKYVDSKYFAHVLGYTGNISSEQLQTLNDQVIEEGGEADTYSLNDVVGKSGIESYMETTLQGTKGYEKVIVDVTGKVISILETQDAVAGNDVYLTIDKDLTIATYNIIEQKLAGMVAAKIINTKEYHGTENSSSSDIKIPIYDVYYATINNSIINIKHFTDENAGEKEKEVYSKFLSYREQAYEKLRRELLETKTPYNKLSNEYQVYESNIVTLLNKNGIIDSDKVDTSDPTYIAWTTDEVISLCEYLNYCISMNWIDVTKLKLDDKYSDSSEIYARIVDEIIELVDGNTELQKRFYKYMLLSDVISGRDICIILCEQGLVDVPIEDESAIYDNKISAYQFMMNRITNIDITPAQLALDPCNASVVVTDVNTGNVLALVTYPGYDNNKMANSIDAEYYAQLINDKSNPQYNFATQNKTAPGSTFKMVSASAALMEGILDLNDRINCTGLFSLITPSPKCWKTSGHGYENVTTAIRDSCNYFFYDVGYLLSTGSGSFVPEEGLAELAKYADMYGLSEKTGIEIGEETPNVSDSDPVRSAIGQGTNSYTTVGLARYVTTVANSGTCFDLTLIDKVCDSDKNTLFQNSPKVRNIVEMPDSYWNSIHSGMRMVVQNKAYFSDLAVNVAGKTGTAEQSKSRPNHALFVCYAPYENPEVAIATRIPFGYSSDYAAQLTREVIKYYYGLAEEDDIITGTAIESSNAVSNEM